MEGLDLVRDVEQLTGVVDIGAETEIGCLELHQPEEVVR